MRPCEVRNLGLLDYASALRVQQEAVAARKAGEVPDRLLIVEHPHVITAGRNAHRENVLAGPDVLERAGIAFHETNRGGDVTYHGPGQIVGYPILDLREWKRDVVEYVRGIEQSLIDALASFGIQAACSPGETGVWTNGAKIAAIGVHISRWVTSHGFALNVDTDLSYFRYIVPCGLTKPVTSMREQGSRALRDEVVANVTRSFGRYFDLEMQHAVLAGTEKL